MRAMANQMRIQAALEAGRRVSTKLALVTSYDPDAYAVKVQLQPEGVLTGWMPIASPMVGNGWGFYAAPSEGDQVKVSFVEGDVESGVVEGAFYNDQDRPLSVPSGEIWLVSKGGAKVQLKGENTLNIEATNITSTGTWAHTGDFSVDGNIEATGDIHTPGTVTGDTDVIAADKSGKSHKHGGVQTGGSQTGGPV